MYTWAKVYKRSIQKQIKYDSRTTKMSTLNVCDQWEEYRSALSFSTGKSGIVDMDAEQQKDVE